MKKYAVLVFFVLFLSGCSDSSHELDAGMQLRSRLLQAASCSFTADITAEDSVRICSFSADCSVDTAGNVSFTVTQPATIAGISGKLTADEGQIIFDGDKILKFPLQAEGQISPVSGPWLLINALRSGFLVSACTEEEEKRLSIDDTYNGSDLRLDIWLNRENVPSHGDVLQDGRRILTLNVTNFEIS